MISSHKLSIVLYLLCAIVTALCLIDEDKLLIKLYEATFKQFRDKKSETDHYRLVYSAIQVFHQCDVNCQANESEAKFRSFSFVGQIDLVMEAFVKIHLLPSGLINPVKQRAMTEQDFRNKYQTWSQNFMDNLMSRVVFVENGFNCNQLKNFLVDVFSTEQSDSDKYADLLTEFKSYFYEIFEKREVKKPKAKEPKAKDPTWKLPRWQTVVTYFGAATVVGLLIAGGVHFWPTDPTLAIETHVSNNFTTQVSIPTSGFTSTGGNVGATLSSWSIVIIVIIMISLVAIVAAFVVYYLLLDSTKKTNGTKEQHSDGNTTSSNSKSKSTTTTECENSSTGFIGATIPVPH